MDRVVMDEQAALALKIDRLAAQLEYLAEQARIAERARAERAELLRDLMPVVNQAYGMAVEQLEEVGEYADLNDLLRLLKRLMRNGPNLERMLGQLESLTELGEIAAPLGSEAFGGAVTALAELERKGYFAFARGGARVLDNVVTSFGEDDLQRLGDNVVLILQTIKTMTQPEIMRFLGNMVAVIDGEAGQPVDTSLLTLWRQMRDPDVRRGFALTLRVLRALGRQAAGRAGSVS